MNVAVGRSQSAVFSSASHQQQQQQQPPASAASVTSPVPAFSRLPSTTPTTSTKTLQQIQAIQASLQPSAIVYPGIGAQPASAPPVLSYSHSPFSHAHAYPPAYVSVSVPVPVAKFVQPQYVAFAGWWKQ